MRTLFCAFPILFLFASCQKEIPTKLTGYFYTTDTSSVENAFHLFIDGVDKGILPQVNKPFTEIKKDDSVLKSQALKIDFMSGTHLFQVRANGNLVVSAEHYYKFYKNQSKSGVKGSIGASGSLSFDNANEVYVWLAKSL